jgi:hypothetical protein
MEVCEEALCEQVSCRAGFLSYCDQFLRKNFKFEICIAWIVCRHNLAEFTVEFKLYTK